MATSPTLTNTSGLSSNSYISLFRYTGSNPLSAVVAGWYAQGNGLLNIPVTSVIDSSISVRIDINSSTPLFQNGQSYYFTELPIPDPSAPPVTNFNTMSSHNHMCFKEGSKILCVKDSKEVYVPIENIKKGDLVKTIELGALKVTVVMKSILKNPAGPERVKDKLYKLTKDNYDELTEDLYITGGHAVLVNTVTLEQQAKIKKAFGRLFLTGLKYRLMAFADERAEPCTEAATYAIYHLALENDAICYNYGIYANGLLVESCNTKELLGTSSPLA